jgi:hypothetical protein
MADEPENHTIRRLQEMREEMREGFAEMGERLSGVAARLDGLTHIVRLLAGHSHGLEERLTRIEERQDPAS